MRRKQCEITDSKSIEKILSKATIGRMATIDAQGYPYVTPVNFVYYQERIYFHCALKGEKLDNLARNSRVCFQVDIPLAYLDAGFTVERSPCKLHQFYHCVIMRGTAKILPDCRLKVEALNALVAKHEAGMDFMAVHAEMPDYNACHVVEIAPEKITAKSELAQGKSEKVKRAIAEHLKARNRPGDRETIDAFGFDPDRL